MVKKEGSATTTNTSSAAKNDADTQKGTITRSMNYAHPNIPKLLKLTDVRTITICGKREQETFENKQKIQLMCDGSKLTKENIYSKVLSFEYPICVTDTPETIGIN